VVAADRGCLLRLKIRSVGANDFRQCMTVYPAVEKRSSAALRCKPYRSTYFYIRLALRFLRALHLSIFEQPALSGCFSTPC
jgi:hypothetical protein